MADQQEGWERKMSPTKQRGKNVGKDGEMRG